MTTLSDLIERTRRHLYTETRDSVDKLAAAISSTSATSFTSTYQNSGIQVGSVVSIDLEEMYVLAVSGATVTVQRGWNGSTAATHSNGALVFVNPKVSAFQILGAINDDLNDLSAQGLFATASAELTYQAGTDSYNLTGATDVLRVLEVRYEANDGTSRWPVLPPSQWSLGREQETDDFATGFSITVTCGEPGRQLRVTYAKPFTALSSLSDNVAAVTGLHPAAHDLPPLGAALNLTVGAEIARNWLTQGNTRRAEEVPPQARASQMRSVALRREQRINAERARLYQRWPAVVR